CETRKPSGRRSGGRRKASCSANGESASHPGSGMTRNGAEVAVLRLLLEGDDQPGRLARADQWRLLAVDLEVVEDMAHVLENERHLPWPGDRLRREPEEELAALDRDRRRCSGCRPVRARGGELNQRERRKRDRDESGEGADGELSHLHDSFADRGSVYGSEYAISWNCGFLKKPGAPAPTSSVSPSIDGTR